ncbi:MAG: phosphate signaling complex protein PhoU [Endomicrobium sp.]|jgi:phosphate transport system protein|nr:phosphate signaling complex protein PhoU [Endomicrobium sp.]
MRHFDSEINDLQDCLISMAGLVQEMIKVVMKELVDKDLKQSGVVLCLEKKVNIQELVIDDKCLKLIALNQPVGVDLRFITSAMRINSDLERMGDEAVNISEKAVCLTKNTKFKPLTDIPEMIEIVQDMIMDCIKAFNTNDSELALSVLIKDNKVDNLRNRVFNNLKNLMIKALNVKIIQEAVDLMFIVKSIERLGDHATNISEDVIFMVHGKNVRHPKVRR